MTGPSQDRDATGILLSSLARLRGQLRATVLVVAAAIAVVAPAATAYFKWNEVTALAGNSAVASAEVVSRLASQYPESWMFMENRINDLIRQQPRLTDPIETRVEATDGTVVSRHGKEVAWTAIIVREPIGDGAGDVGHLILVVDPTRTVYWIGLAALAGLICAGVLVLAFHFAPFSLAESALHRLAHTQEDLREQLGAATKARDRAQSSEAEMRAAQERAHNAERRLRDAIDAMPDGFRLWDANDRLVLCNRAFQGMTMVSAATRLGGTFEEEIREAAYASVIKDLPDDREVFVSRRLEQRRKADGTPMIHQRVDGRWYEIREHRTEEGGVVQIRTDITLQKMHEEELRVARDAAEQGSRAKTEFLSRMSHDLRTPLNAMLGFSQILLTEEGPEALTAIQRSAVETIERTGRHLLSQVEDILDFSRIENRAVTLLTQPLNVEDIVKEALTLTSMMAVRHGAAIIVDPSFSLLPNAVGDHRRVVQVLTNLLSNALKYAAARGAITLAASVESGFLRVEVRDRGPGIPLDRQSRIFEPFNRAGAEDMAAEGTGIGLAIAKSLVEQMGGAIDFVSAPETGTIFWFTLPVAAEIASAAPTGAPTASAQTATLRDIGAATILYVEDTPENRTLVRRLLGRYANIKYLEAESAESGIEIARREMPDVVLMDMRMPGMSGIEALHVLRADPRTRHIPIVALTGAAMPDEAVEIGSAGFDGYITKPFRIGDLLAKLIAVIERRIHQAAR